MENIRRLLFSDEAGAGSISDGIEGRASVGPADGGPEETKDRALLRAYLEMRERPPERIDLLLLHADPIMEREEEL